LAHKVFCTLVAVIDHAANKVLINPLKFINFTADRKLA
jgi:hypothetical protein